jgi:cystine transport system substrate-binding protein
MKEKKWLIAGCFLLVCVILAAVVLLTRPNSEVQEPEPTAVPEVTETAEETEETKDVLAAIRENGKLTIAMEGVWQPWTYHDETGALTGFDVEVGTLIAEGLGVEPEFVETAWDGILAGVDSGRFDIACNGVGYTEERAQSYNFSTPYVYTEMVLVVAEDNQEINAIEDLTGKKTANSPNSTYAMRAEAAGAEVTYVDTLGETMEMLQQGRVDATLNDKDSVDSYLAEHPEAKIRIAAVVAGEPVAVPMQKGEGTETLKAEIDRILEEARQNGKLAELSVKYFGTDLTNR